MSAAADDGTGTLAGVSGAHLRSTARPGVGWLVPAIGLGITGMVLVVVGTFLPWASSGGRTYRSYAMVGLVDRLDLMDSAPIRSLLAVWPYVGPLCLVPLGLAALRRRRAAGGAAIVIGVAVAAGAALVLGYAGTRHVPGVALLSTGPWTVVAGGLTMTAGGVLALVVRPESG
jgi:hypothetical protein